MLDQILFYSGLPEGRYDEDIPNQVVGVNYYGTVPPDWFSDADIAVIEALEGVPRYAEIVARFLHHRLELAPDAEAINLACHSMGCEVVRYLLENDVEGVAGEGIIARWITGAGVVNGAWLAALGPWLEEYADALGIDIIDVIHMDYEWYGAHVPACDGDRTQGNNPAFGDILIHHVLADSPYIEEEFWGLPLLDVVNVDSLPNDGIMWTDDQYFHDQAEEARFTAADGSLLKASRSYVYYDHFAMRGSASTGVVASASLLGSRRVTVTVQSMTLWDDREKDDLWDFDESGEPPAEVVVESAVTWPWVASTTGTDPVVDERRMSHRVVPVTSLMEGETASPGLLVFEAPVFDEMETIRLGLTVLEADWYPTFGVSENVFDSDEILGETVLDVPIVSGTQVLNLGRVDVTLSVQVTPLRPL